MTEDIVMIAMWFFTVGFGINTWRSLARGRRQNLDAQKYVIVSRILLEKTLSERSIEIPDPLLEKFQELERQVREREMK